MGKMQTITNMPFGRILMMCEVRSNSTGFPRDRGYAAADSYSANFAVATVLARVADLARDSGGSAEDVLRAVAREYLTSGESPQEALHSEDEYLRRCGILKGGLNGQP